MPGHSTPPRNGPALDARGLPLGYGFKPDWEVTPRDVARRLAAGPEAAPVLLDCRRPDEWAVARLEGALLIPLDQLPARVDEVRELAREGAAPRDVVIYCHTGRRSLTAAAILRQAGVGDAKSMAGGIDLWSMDVDARVPRY